MGGGAVSLMTGKENFELFFFGLAIIMAYNNYAHTVDLAYFRTRYLVFFFNNSYQGSTLRTNNR